MNLPKIIRSFLCVILLMQSQSATFAFETDQYNLPPEPLADIGDEVSDYAEENLRKALDKINAEIIARQACLERKVLSIGKVSCGGAEKQQARLEFLRSEAAVAQAVYKLLGGGVPPFTNSGT